MSILHSNIIGTEGKELLILHGFLGMGDNWKSHAKNFASLGYRVHLIDQRNHGRSFWSTSFSYRHMAQDVVDYCQAQGLQKVFILGHSMGGKTVMHLACDFPELVSAFIVADIAPKKYAPHHQQILNGLAQLDFDKIDSRAVADQVLSNYVPEPTTRQFLLKNLYWRSPGKLGLRVNIEVLKKASDAIGEGLKPTAHSKLPCLFIKGEASDYILDTDPPSIKHHFPNASITTIPKVGHWLHAENPKLFFEEVSSWLGKQA